MDETAVSVRGGTHYLHRAVDPSSLKTVLGKHRFGGTMREWQAEQGRGHAGNSL
jgi:hypothetical protein